MPKEMKRAIFTVICCAVAGCGNDSNDGASDTAKQLALDELGALALIMTPVETLLGPSDAAGRAFFSDTLGETPDVASCTSGSVTVTQSPQTERPLQYFADAESDATVTAYRFEDCASAAEGVTQDGAIDIGHMAGHDPLDLSDSLDRLAIYGAVEDEYTFTVPVEGETTAIIVEAVTGRAEWRSYDDFSIESGSIVSRFVEVEEAAYWLTWEQGSVGNPFYVDANTGVRSFRANGPYSYASATCEGGQRLLATDEALSRDSDGTPISGSLAISMAGRQLTYEFDSSGSATVSFSTGEQVQISAAEVRDALQGTSCFQP